MARSKLPTRDGIRVHDNMDRGIGIGASVTENDEAAGGQNALRSLAGNSEYSSEATSTFNSEQKREPGNEIEAQEAQEAPSPNKHNHSEFRATEAGADQHPAFPTNSNDMPSRYPPTSYPSSMHTRANSADNAANIVVPIRVGTPNNLTPFRKGGGDPLPTLVVPVRAKSVEPSGKLSNAASSTDFSNIAARRGDSSDLVDKYRNDDRSTIQGQGERPETLDNIPRFPATEGSLDVEMLMEKYHTELAKLDAKDAETMEEMENLLDMFKAWQTVGKQKEEERAEKRLRTQSKLVQAEEARLKKKRETHAKAMETLQAFMEIVKDS